jgi:MFS family permease
MGLLGTLIGAFILGCVGDRIGRRPTLILATAGLGGLVLMRFTDKRGAIAITTMPAVTAALLLITGLVYIGHDGFLVISALIGSILGREALVSREDGEPRGGEWQRAQRGVSLT